MDERLKHRKWVFSAVFIIGFVFLGLIYSLQSPKSEEKGPESIVSNAPQPQSLSKTKQTNGSGYSLPPTLPAAAFKSDKPVLLIKPAVDKGKEVVSEEAIKQDIEKLISSHDFENALDVTEQWLAKDLPPSIRERVAQYKGNLLLATGKVEEAYAVYWDTVKSGSRTDVREWATGKLYVAAKQLGKVDVLLADLERLTVNDPDNLRLKHSLADMYGYAGQTDKEINLRSQLFKANATDTDNGRKLIAVYQRTANPLAVAKISGQMAKSDLENQPYHLVRQAKYLLEAKAVDDAQMVCREIYDSPRTNAQTLLWCGYLYKQIGHLKLAEAAFEKGAVKAEEQYRKERCQIEACEVRSKQGRLSDDDNRFLTLMAKNAIATGVRELASQILTLGN